MERKKFDEPKLTQIEELTARLVVANKELLQAKEENRKLLEHISHDLRAPLTAIRSALDYLKEIESSPQVDVLEICKITQLIDQRTLTLESLIQDLYYLTSLENGREKKAALEIPIEQLLEEYFYAVEIDQKYKDRLLQLDLPDELHCMVTADAQKINRLLDNLFTNALKYSYEGAKITLGAYIPSKEEVRMYFQVEEDKHYVVCYVKDTGIGMKEEYFDKIFDRLFMIEDARTPSRVTGSGLGLSIVKQIVMQHHGFIRCESKYGSGSCFYLYFPCQI